MPVERLNVVNGKSILGGTETEIAGKALCACGLHRWVRASVWSKKYDGALVEFCDRLNCQIVRGVWKCKDGGKPKLYKNGQIVLKARFGH